MGIQDDVFDIRATLEARRGKDRDAMIKAFEGIERLLWSYEAEVEELRSIVLGMEGVFQVYSKFREERLAQESENQT